MINSKKYITTIMLLLAIVFLFIIVPFVLFYEQTDNGELENKTTAIATENELNKVLPQEVIERAGIKLYASEEEYLEEQRTLTREFLSQVNLATEAIVRHRFIVKDYKTNKPISGAVLIIDKVPRFTDVTGTAEAEVFNDVVEIRVEKDGYNPYIEYYDINDAQEDGITEKTIFLKTPSSDLEIYNVTLDYDGEKANVVEQSYSFDKMESEGDTFNIKIETSNNADMYYLYEGDNYLKSDPEGFFENIWINFKEEGSVTFEGKEFKVKCEKDGIQSEFQLLNIKLSEISDLSVTQYLDLGNMKDLVHGLDQSNFLGDFQIDIKSILTTLLDIKKDDANKNFSVLHDNLKGTYKFVFGVDLDIDSKNKTQAQSIMTTFEKSYKMRRNNINPLARKQSFCEAMFGAFGKASKKETLEKKMSISGFSANIDFNVVAYIELSDKIFTGEVQGSKAVVGGGICFEAAFNLSFLKHYIAFNIPVYFQLNLGGSIGIDYDYNSLEEIRHTLDLILEFSVKAEIGVGLKNILSAGIYGQGNIKVIFDVLNNFDDDVYINLSFGLIVTLLGYDIDIKIVDEMSIDEVLSATMYTLSNQSTNGEGDYSDARPQSVYLNNEKLTVWLEKDEARDEYNQIKLMYSYGDKVGAVLDDGKTDFYPELVTIDNNVYVVWHKSTALFDGETEVSEAFMKSKVMLSKFNLSTESFETVKDFGNDSMQTLPKIAKNSTESQMAVAWLSNTEGNPLGSSGESIIYVSELTNGVWGSPQIAFETDKTINSYDITYMDGELRIACSIDVDGKLDTTDDYDIYYGNIGETININNDDVIQAAPTFGKYLGETVLYYFDDYRLVIDSLDGSEKEVVIDDIGFAGNYELLNGDTNQVIYTRQGLDKAELCLAKYDTALNKWIAGIPTGNENNYMSINACINGGNIEISGVTYEENSAGDGFVIGNISEESLSIDMIDIELLEAYMLDTVKVGENVIYCYVKNKGVNYINALTVSINGVNQTVSLESPLLPDKEALVVIETVLTSIPQALEVSIEMEGDMDTTNNDFDIDINYAELELTVMQRIVAGKESFNIKINNVGHVNEVVDIIIRKGGPTGEIVYRENDITIISGESIGKEVSFDYKAIGCNTNDKLFIEAVSDRQMVTDCSTFVFINEEISEEEHSDNDLNNVQQLLLIAKKLMGGII